MKEQDRFTPKRLLLAGVFTAASIGIAFLAKQSVDYIDSAFRPTYVLRGNPVPPMPEPPEWQRQTNWRITYQDYQGNVLNPK